MLTGDKEYFAVIGNNTIKSNDSKTIRITKTGGNNSSFGHQTIHSMDKAVYRWNLKVNKPSIWAIIVGISSDWITKAKSFHVNEESFNYGYSSYGSKWSKGKYEQYGQEWKDNDVIGIKLDMVNRTIEFFVNGQSQGVAYKDIDVGHNISYKLAVYIHWQGHGVTIKKFEKVFPNDNDEQRQSDATMIKDLLKQNKALQENLKAAESENVSLKTEADTTKLKVEQLTARCMASEKSLKKQIEQLKAQNIKLKHKSKALELENTELRQNMTIFKNTAYIGCFVSVFIGTYLLRSP